MKLVEFVQSHKSIPSRLPRDFRNMHNKRFQEAWNKEFGLINNE
jgi:hypothetical protein